MNKFRKAVCDGDIDFVGDELKSGRAHSLVNTLYAEDIALLLAPLHCAARAGNVPMMRLLVEYGADVSMLVSEDTECHMIYTGPFAIDEQEVYGGEYFLSVGPLHYAVWEGKRDAARWLLRHGAEHDMYTIAALGCTEELAGFLAQGADRHADILLQWAAVCGAEQNIPLLLNCRLSPEATAEALGYAIAHEHDAVVSLLLAAGAKFEGHPCVCLNQSVMNGKTHQVRLLIQAGVDLNLGPEECHPLVQAASRGHLDIVKLLLEAGSRPDISAEFFPETAPGQFSQATGTLLQAAIMCGHDQVAAFLQEWRRSHGTGGLEPKSAEELLDMWKLLTDRLRLSASNDKRLAAGRELIDMYSSNPRRAYHNLGHLSACLAELEKVGAMSSDTTLVAAALWFHDAVYEPDKTDNELCSARLAVKVFEQLGMAPDRRRKIARLINATSHLDEPESYDEELICDIDLAVLGKPWSEYSRYAAAVRREYSLPSEQYDQGREAFLRNMLTRRYIYHTRRFRDHCEQTARKNMQRELVELEK